MFGVSYQTSESDTQATQPYSAESDGYGFSIGYFIQRYTLVTYGHAESETDYTGIDLDHKSKGNLVSLSTVILRGNGTAFSLSAAYAIDEQSDGDEFKYTTITGDYYFNARLGGLAPLSPSLKVILMPTTVKQGASMSAIS